MCTEHMTVARDAQASALLGSVCASSEQQRERLGLDSIEYYIARRQLRWLGHVLRMGPERLPRRMLSAWVAHKRPAGAPQFTYGRGGQGGGVWLPRGGASRLVGNRG